MKNPFAWCFGRGKKGRRKPVNREREEPVPEEPVQLQYPLFDPRRTQTHANLPPTPSDRSSSPSVPQELDTHEKITLPKDEEEEELPVVEEIKEESPAPTPPPPSPSPPPTPSPHPPQEEPADAAGLPPASPVVTTPVEDKRRKEATREPTPSQEPSRSRPSPSGPSVSREPPSTTRAAAPPSTVPDAEVSVPLSRQTEPPSPTRAAPASMPQPLAVASSSPLAGSAHLRTETAMSPLEKLASARLGTHPSEELEEAEAATAPCTPPVCDEGPAAAETEMQQLERTRRLQQKLLALEESVQAEELQLCHDSTRRRRKIRRHFPRYRVSWRCVQAAIDFYADAQDGILEDIRMRLDTHEPRDCRICRNFDYSDVPLLP